MIRVTGHAASRTERATLVRDRAVSNRNPSCLGCSLTGTAPLPEGSRYLGLQSAFAGLIGFTDHRLSFFGFTDYRLRGPRTISPSHVNVLRDGLVANTHRNSYRNWTSLLHASLSVRCALRPFGLFDSATQSYDSYRTAQRGPLGVYIPPKASWRSTALLLSLRCQLSTIFSKQIRSCRSKS
jgi:hypothetical protein